MIKLVLSGYNKAESQKVLLLKTLLYADGEKKTLLVTATASKLGSVVISIKGRFGNLDVSKTNNDSHESDVVEVGVDKELTTNEPVADDILVENNENLSRSRIIIWKSN